MFLVKKFSCLLILVLLIGVIYETAYPQEMENIPSFNGNIFPVSINDSVFYNYKFQFRNCVIDSIKFSSQSYELNNIIFLDTARQFLDSSKVLLNPLGRDVLRGYLYIILPEEIIDFWRIDLEAFYTKNDNQTGKLSRWEYIAPIHVGLGMELWFPAAGYYSSKSPGIKNKQGLLLGWGLSAGVSTPNSTYEISSSFEGNPKNGYYFNEALKLRYIKNVSGRFLPYTSFLLSLKNTKIKLGDYSSARWGFDFGAQFENDYEKLEYYYSTTHGGYHTVSLYLKSYNSNYSSIGTRYRIYFHESVWAIRISLIVEGVGLELEGSANDPHLIRPYNRPKNQYSLSKVGQISTLAALALAVYLIF